MVGVCSVCKIEPIKYTCPACSVKTCGVVCVKKHKEWFNCTGIIDQTRFVPKDQLDETNLKRDYSFLTSFKREVDIKKTDLEVKPTKKLKIVKDDRMKRVNAKFGDINSSIKRLNTLIIHAPPGMSRVLQNKSGYDKRSSCFAWSVEWIFKELKFVCKVKETNTIEKLVPKMLIKQVQGENNNGSTGKLPSDQTERHVDITIDVSNGNESVGDKELSAVADAAALISNTSNISSLKEEINPVLNTVLKNLGGIVNETADNAILTLIEQVVDVKQNTNLLELDLKTDTSGVIPTMDINHEPIKKIETSDSKTQAVEKAAIDNNNNNNNNNNTQTTPQLFYYLKNPLDSNLLKLDASQTLTDNLRDKIVLEFPTILISESELEFVEPKEAYYSDSSSDESSDSSDSESSSSDSEDDEIEVKADQDGPVKPIVGVPTNQSTTVELSKVEAPKHNDEPDSDESLDDAPEEESYKKINASEIELSL